MDDDEFELIVNKAVKTIPNEFKEKLNNVALIVEDFPTEYQNRKISRFYNHGLLLGLYEGIPLTKRRGYGIGGQLPDKITIFKGNILFIARDKRDLELIVRNTVWHEIAHHFGMDERKVREAEAKRRERLNKLEAN